MPSDAMRLARRMTAPPAQRSPSPNTEPAPPEICALPWKYRCDAVVGMFSAYSVSVELAAIGLPDATSDAPVPSEWRQPSPSPITLLFAHGHAVALPSP